MANLSRAQIETLAKSAGFAGSDVSIAVAVALAESGGNPRAHNTTPPDNSYGLWQINMYSSLGPNRRKWFGLNSNDELFDPSTNAKAAFKIQKASGWKAWTTYTRGTYKKFLTAADSGAGENGESETPNVESNAGTGVTGAFNAFGSTIFKSFANVAGILVAIAFLVLGVVLLARNQIANVVPAGKVGKVLKGVAK